MGSKYKNVARVMNQRPFPTNAETVEEFQQELKERGLNYDVIELMSVEEYDKYRLAELEKLRYVKFLVRVWKAIYSKMDNNYRKVRSGKGDLVAEVAVLARSKPEAVEVLKRDHPEYDGGFYYKAFTRNEILRENESKKNIGQ